MERFTKSSHWWTDGEPIHIAVAAELRSLHAENETLRTGYDAARLEIESLQAQHAAGGKGRVAPLAGVEVLSESEAVVAFAAWLSCRDAVTTLSSRHDAAPAAELAQAFVDSQGLAPPRENYHLLLLPCPDAGADSTAAQAQAQQCGAGAGCCAQAARIEELEAQLEAVGGVQRIAGPDTTPVAQAMDLLRIFWQQHTRADALSMSMDELHADVERVIRAAREAAQAQAEVPAQASEPWYGHKFKESQSGIWRCECGKTVKETTADWLDSVLEDAARLDWLEADESKCVFHLGKNWYTRPSYGMPYRKRASLRAAIDAAMAAAMAAQGGNK